MLTELATSLIAMAVPTTMGTCPQGVIEQLDGLYRWQVQRMDSNEDRVKALSSQRQRFTPSLFRLLIEARQLTPSSDGRFLDFDVFSNTQVATFGAKVSGCSAENGNSIQARVDVEAGLTGRPSGTPRRLLYEMNQDGAGSWRINNITYLDGKVFQLRSFLQELVHPTH
ncbi:DUF3828 domain-containing protein [Synechococcus sp. UW179A]|uniref:DUF3828 domain-containing protein n=1 Tax=Synechococcus sp. UW179A TaxID=2575510 RepID=UPI000E0FC571|nr:DUF3828 domain-containing protein [Synechococcus sp. UW179A]